MKLSRLFLLILAAAILLPIAGEVLVRRFPVLLPVNGQIRMQAIMMKDRVLSDPEIGFVRQPRLHQRVQTMDFTYLRETDSRGFPNRDPWPKQADIVILGDSLVMGEGTGLDRSFVGRFQRANPNLKVVNLGIAGAGPDRQLLAYRKYGAGLFPSVVLAFLYAAADITNSEHFERWRKEAPHADYNRFRLDLGRKEPRAWLDRLRLAGVISSRFETEEPGAQEVNLPDSSRVFLDESTLAYVRHGVKTEQIERLIRPLVQLRELAESQGATAYVVLIPSKEEIFTRSYSVADTVRGAMRRAGIDYLDLYPLMGLNAIATSPYFCRDIHLNDYGSRLVADYLTDWFRNRG
ncbi:MAG: SGNH/GDSL hydrolase family protein [Acidobacteriota bacterium]